MTINAVLYLHIQRLIDSLFAIVRESGGVLESREILRGSVHELSLHRNGIEHLSLGLLAEHSLSEIDHIV